MTQRLRWVVAAVTVLVAFLGWQAFQSRLQANSEQFVSNLLAAEAATYTRPVHREPLRNGSVSECVEALLPLFHSFSTALDLEVWAEQRQLCLGNLRAAELSDEAKQRYAVFKSLRPKVADCLHEEKVAPGKISRFAEGHDVASTAFAAMDQRMGLSNCGVIVEHLEAGDMSSALAECADAFAWFRDATYMGAGQRIGDAESVGLPLLVPCGEAIDVATTEQRFVFAKEMRAIRAGLPTTREVAERQRLRTSLWTYAPYLTPASRAQVTAILTASGHGGESYETVTEQLKVKAGWSASERVFSEAIAEVEKPRSPERQARLLALSRQLANDPGSSTVSQIISEAGSREVVDSALALLIAAAELDLDHPQPISSAVGFSTEVIEEGIGFRLLVPKASPVIVTRTRPQ